VSVKSNPRVQNTSDGNCEGRIRLGAEGENGIGGRSFIGK